MELAERFWNKVDRSGECWLWTAATHDFGYGWFRLPHKKEYAHRVAYELAYGPIANDLWVLHRCDNPPCVRPDHLFLGTHRDNMNDATQKRRMAFGDRQGMRKHPEKLKRGLNHWNGKLSDNDVTSIRARRAAGEGNNALAREFHVAHSTVCLIVKDVSHRLR